MVALCGLSLVTGGYSSLWCSDFRCRLQKLQHMDSVVVVLGLRCSTACGIFLAHSSNSCPLHWQVDSYLLCHQRSPSWSKSLNSLLVWIEENWNVYHKWSKALMIHYNNGKLCTDKCGLMWWRLVDTVFWLLYFFSEMKPGRQRQQGMSVKEEVWEVWEAGTRQNCYVEEWRSEWTGEIQDDCWAVAFRILLS